MKNFLKTSILAIVAITALYACNSNDDSGDGSNTTNQDPANFSATVDNISENGATVNWTQATDPDGDTVTYTVNLNGTEIATNLSVFTYSFTGLSASVSYSGTIVASDGNDGSSTASFGFTTESVPATLHLAYAEFDTDNTDIMLSGNNVVIDSNGYPNHTSPYWSNTTERCTTTPQGQTLCTNSNTTLDHALFVAPTVTSFDMMAPGNIDDFNGSYSLTISANPQLAANSTSTGLGPIGIAVSGAMIYNDEEGPNVPLDNAVGSLDYTAAHTGPQSYHYHLETKAWSEDDDKLIGIIADGFFLYGRKCNSTGVYPTDLDTSGGHTSTTQFSDGASEYHYHIQNDLYLNEFYILFPGDYQGTPSNIQ